MQTHPFRFLANIILYLLFLCVALGGMLEATIGVLHQLDLNGNLKGPLKYYYARYYRHVYSLTRDIIQYQSDCARYDKELYYTLRPGTCVFKNEEFETTVHVNSLGLRDDEISLKNPKVIFLGDSHTMGWGVQQDETFPQVFEGLTGLRTLNGGISSYGTPRELMLLKKLNLEEVQYVFIQYAGNDIDENQAFFEDGSLKISAPEKYQELRQGHEEGQKYFLGRYSKVFSNLVWLKISAKFGSDSGENKTSADSNIEAKYFINALEKMDLDHLGPKIIVFSIGIYNKNDPKFVNDLSALLKGSSLENLVSAVHVSNILNQDDYFTLDAHINNKGHQKIAQFLSDKYFRERGGEGIGHPDLQHITKTEK